MKDELIEFLPENESGFRSNSPLEPLPHAKTAMILGIVSLVIFLFFPLLAIGLAITAIVLGSKALRKSYDFPDVYLSDGRGPARSGKVMGIIALCLSVMYMILLSILAFFFGLFFGLSGVFLAIVEGIFAR